MKEQETILAGQILQCRDKLMARRHCIPEDMQNDWQTLMLEASLLEPRIDPKSHKKILSYKGNAQSLRSLLGQLTQIAKHISH